MQNEAKESLWLIEITGRNDRGFASKNGHQRQQNELSICGSAEEVGPPNFSGSFTRQSPAGIIG